MAAEDMGLVQAQQRLDDGLNHPHLVFQDTFNCGPPPAQRRASATASSVGEPKATTRELTGGFIDHHQPQHSYFHQPTAADFRRAMFSSAAASGDRPHQDSNHNWNLGASSTPSGDGSEEDDDDVEDDDEEDDNDDENEVEGLVRVNNGNNSNEKSNNDRNKMGYQKSKPLSSFGLKDGDVVGRSGSTNEENGMRNAVTVASADGELYYSQYMQRTGDAGPNAGQKDVMVVENGCGFSGRKEGLYLSESGESLRTILSDPLTGVLMDDAMILPCGHSFGSGGIQHILRTKLCHTCFKAVSEDSISPNLSLRAAVQAFRREEEMQIHRVSKRRRERCEQDRGTYGDSGQTDHSRGKGVQFPFAVTDRVIIKGNKRTPPRFVGREAIVTTQCLNGWYVVKTLDNAESVKLQYRSLAKVAPDNASPKPISSKMTTPNWLQTQHIS